ncbi:phage tail assembly chaperone [Chitinolyticbacter meiyuanensis]|uniref:phage tail assembly chaperone n=1 Tax=Chitinolyticbacter meiyuanensis TaxID=682798 RepID=UPI00402B0A8F
MQALTGTTPDGLIPPPFPIQLTYLWRWFVELSGARTGNGFGPNSISYAEIAAWSGLKRIQLADWELDTLVELDRAWLDKQ